MSLFGRVTRYRMGAAHDPRENRLTEVTAGVLERTDGLALEVARSWLQPRPHDAAGAPAWTAARDALSEEGVGLRGVRTQRYTRRGGFVDLELSFGPRLATVTQEIVLWVEVKHGISPHEDQLEG